MAVKVGLNGIGEGADFAQAIFTPSQSADQTVWLVQPTEGVFRYHFSITAYTLTGSPVRVKVGTTAAMADYDLFGANVSAGTVTLLGAFHDLGLKFFYPTVHAYRVDLTRSSQGHGDWRYDELRLSDQGYLLHEIQWANAGSGASWLIEAKDVEFCSWQLNRSD